MLAQVTVVVVPGIFHWDDGYRELAWRRVHRADYNRSPVIGVGSANFLFWDRLSMPQPLQISTNAGNDLKIRRIVGEEHLGRPFTYELELFSDQAVRVVANNLLGHPAAISVELPENRGRKFHGIITRFQYVGTAERRHHYRATIRPWIWLLSQEADCRIFQNKTTPDIVEAVFREAGLTDFRRNLNQSYTAREYCVQYRESSLDFVTRLLEHEGIYYYVEHGESKHTVVLVDDITSLPDFRLSKLEYVPGGQAMRRDEFISSWRREFQLHTGNASLRDYDFVKPRADLTVRSQGSRTYNYAHFEVYDFPGSYLETAHGEKLSKLRVDEFSSRFDWIAASGQIASLICGDRFELFGHSVGSQNGSYIVASTRYDILNGGGESGGDGDNEHYECSIAAIPSDVRYRIPRTTPKPYIRGPQTAVVVGPKKKEIWCDEYGRVKLQFFWDRKGKSDENSSRWVRVAQLWAGTNWGGIHIPRIGQEVVVEFLEGDPDQPIVTGRVYNSALMPPYPLPDNQTQSGIKSRSTESGTEETFNELRFEDKKDAEEIYFHAEKDFQRIVENNDILKIGFEKQDKGNQTVEIFNNQTVTIGTSESEDGSQTITVYKNRTVKLTEGNQKLQVQKGSRETLVDKGDDKWTVGEGNRTATVSKGNDTLLVSQGHREATISNGNDSLTVDKGNLTIKVSSGTCSIEAGTKIELKVGSSTIKIEAASITLDSPQIKISGSGKLEASSGGMAQVSASGPLKLAGAIVQIN